MCEQECVLGNEFIHPLLSLHYISLMNAHLLGVGVILEREAKLHVGILKFYSSLCKMFIMHLKLKGHHLYTYSFVVTSVKSRTKRVLTKG